jgi:hypothetical protein
MKELYGLDDETRYILATDAKSLYGKAMTVPLPYGNFEWFNPSHITIDFVKGYKLPITSITCTSSKNKTPFLKK